jgi:hypothetical protein
VGPYAPAGRHPPSAGLLSRSLPGAVTPLARRVAASSLPMLTERDLILRLIRQLAEVLAAALRLRREGRRDEALRQIDAITGRLTGMDAGALCLFGEAPLVGLARELKVPLACLLRARARLLRDARRPDEARQAYRAARMLVASARPPP